MFWETSHLEDGKSCLALKYDLVHKQERQLYIFMQIFMHRALKLDEINYFQNLLSVTGLPKGHICF